VANPATDGISTDQDEELEALDGLAATIEDNVRDERLLVRRIRELRADRTLGRSWHDVLGRKRHSAVLELSARVLGRATAFSSALRRRLAAGLRAEGATIPAIGEIFGVSHQRVSTLLRPRTSGGGRIL